MSYKVICQPFFTDDIYTLHNEKSSELKLISLKLTLELNKSGILTFEIAQTHPYYDKIIKMGCEITIYRNNEIVFIGRPISEDIDFYGTKSITCESILGYLLDSIQLPPYTYEDTVENVFKKVIDVHNSMVDNFKKFKVGTVDVVDGDTSNDDNIIKRWSLDDYINSLQFINEKLIDTIGGFLKLDYKTRTLNYLQSAGNESSQTICFGKNLLDLTQCINADELATVIIPLGAKEPQFTDYANRRLTIARQGKPHTLENICLEDEDGIKLFGKIIKTIDFENTVAYRKLKDKGASYLKEVCNLGLTIELSALDLSCVNVDIEAFNLGDQIRVISKPHNLDSRFLLSKMDFDLQNPANNKITLGKTIPSLTSSMSSYQNKMSIKMNNKKDVENSQEQTVSTKTAVKQVGENLNLQEQIEQLQKRIEKLESER